LVKELEKVQATVQRAVRKEEAATAARSRWKTVSQLIRILVMTVVTIQWATEAESPVVAFQHVLVAFNSTEHKYGSSQASDHSFDSDSFLVAIDNCSSRCITNCMTDFVGKPKRVKLSVLGIGGNAMATYVGTVRWSIEDNDGKRHDFLIPNTYYNEQCPYRLLSPQHWSAEIGAEQQAWSATDSKAVTLFWEKNRYKRTIRLDGSTNVALLRTAPTYHGFHSFCAQISLVQGPLQESDFMSMPDMVVTDDEESVSSELEQSPTTDDERPAERLHPDLPAEVFDHSIEATKSVHVIPEDVETQHNSPQAEYLAKHYRLGHPSMQKMRRMAENGALPKRLLLAKPPKCLAYMYCKATKRPWRTKAPTNSKLPPPPSRPGAVVSIDQLVSLTPGLIAQMRGFLTKKRYKVTTVFVDQYSGLSYVHFQTSTEAIQTVAAKIAFE
jgi:hypothetical protein